MTFRSAAAEVKRTRTRVPVPSPKRWTSPLASTISSDPTRIIRSRKPCRNLFIARRSRSQELRSSKRPASIRAMVAEVNPESSASSTGCSFAFRRLGFTRLALGRGCFALGLRHGQILAAGLALGLVLAAGDVDVDVCLDLGMERDRHGVEADCLDRAVQRHLAAADGEAAGLHHLGEIAGGHRAVELAGLASLADDDEGLAVDL